MAALTPGQVQSEEAKLIDRLTVRIIQARNGYIVKTAHGQFVFTTLDGAFGGVKAFYEMPGTPTVKPSREVVK